MIQDRLKIAKQGRSPDVRMGRQSFLNCGPRKGFSHGCGGGDVIDVVRVWRPFSAPYTHVAAQTCGLWSNDVVRVPYP